jgi:RNA polymerase sigma-70 factor (ECF subfamily)
MNHARLGMLEDADLAARVLEDGDEAAFRVLYRRHTPAVYQFALRLVGGSEADAEDVVQDAWLRAVRSLGGFRWKASFRTWITGIALNRAREIHRKRSRSPEHEAHDGAPSPAVPAALHAERMDLERAITALPDGYRTVLVLHDVEGFTHQEIGERLEITTGTSRSQLHHARRAMRGLLAGSSTASASHAVPRRVPRANSESDPNSGGARPDA